MVFFFKSRDGWDIYMGTDKYENDKLIQHSFPNDIWFHVDEVSSAHVYLRLDFDRLAPSGEAYTIDNIPSGTLEDCVQLVKANSISGHKMPTVTVIYTYVSNLRKDIQHMDVGTVGFHNEKDVHRVQHVSTDKMIVKRVEKTRAERTVADLKKDREERERVLRVRHKEESKKRYEEKVAAEKARKEEEEIRSYSSVMKTEYMTSNTQQFESAEEFEDDFI